MPHDNNELMVQLKVNQITYEALGKLHVTYTDMDDLSKIIGCIQLITDTAQLRDLKHVTVSKSDYDNNNLNHVKSWYEKIGAKLNEDEVAEYLAINKRITGSIVERHIPEDEE